MGIMEKKIETTISLYIGVFIGIMENKIATTVVFGLGIQAQPYSSVFNEVDLHSDHSTVVLWTSLLALFSRGDDHPKTSQKQKVSVRRWNLRYAQHA